MFYPSNSKKGKSSLFVMMGDFFFFYGNLFQQEFCDNPQIIPKYVCFLSFIEGTSGSPQKETELVF